MHPFLNTAIRAARKAGDIIVRAQVQEKPIKIHSKGPYDYVTQIDQAAEEAIIETIHKAYPAHSFLAEESGEAQHQNAEAVWIIDPLDGTTNFIHGLPQYTISIALQVAGKIEHAVIYQPITQDLYTASRGAGAKLNERRIRVSGQTQAQGMLIAAGLPQGEASYEHFLQLTKFMNQNHCRLRNTGSTALNLAYVASGALDGVWELGIKPWDIAAGILLIKEAGGMVLDGYGEENYFHNQSLIAAPTKLMKHFLPAVKLPAANE